MSVTVDYSILIDKTPKEISRFLIKWRRMANINRTTLVLNSVNKGIMNFIYDGFDSIFDNKGNRIK